MDDFHKQKTLPDRSLKQPYFPVPKQIGPYQIENLLNKGGMSYLYLGKHPDSTQPIVIKVLLPKYLKNKELVNRFLKEAEIIEMTQHPNIVQLYGQGKWEKGLYIAMEFIQGVSLRQFIQQKSLTPKRALEIILQVAYALCHLHTHGIIHRDLKPENILITETGDIKVIDFGIAQLHNSLEEARITTKKRIMGTPMYMSPEQKENPSKVSYSSDIYSLGIIAYELILGRLSHGVIHLGLLPKYLRPIIDKALQLDQNDRYQDIVDFITDISQTIQKSLEESEIKDEIVSDEILQMIEQTQSILLPKKAPLWNQLEIGLAVHEGMFASGLYIDFFHGKQNQYFIVLAEPLKLGISSLFHTAVFRGMVRLALEHDDHPIKMLNALNRSVNQDPMKQHFALSFLVLNPDKDLLSFVSCHHAPLSHLAEGSKKMKTVTTPNPLLGKDLTTTFLEATDNWNSGDLLILHSLNVSLQEDKEDLLLALQPQAENFLQKSQSGKKTNAVICIRRNF